MVIVFEGPDGVGKTTTVAALKTLLEEKGTPVLTLGPHYTSFGAKVHELCKTAITDTERVLLYTASYIFVLREASQWLMKFPDGVVLMDRLDPSAEVYNNNAHDLVFDIVSALWEEFEEYCGFAIRYVFLEGSHRKHDSADFYEAQNTPERLQAAYRAVRRSSVVRIDTSTKTVEQVVEAVVSRSLPFRI